MTALVVAALVVAGGLGATARFALDSTIQARFGPRFPIGTVIINLTGSLALGILTGLVLGHLAPEPLRMIIGTGFLGGYTTFSTASVETVRLAQDRRFAAALVNALGTLVGAAVLAGLGLVLGSAL